MVIALITLLVPACAAAGKPGDAESAPADADDRKKEVPWKRIAEKRGIEVFERKHKGKALKEGMAKATVDAPLAAVLAVVTDLEHYDEFMPYTKVASVEHREGNVAFFYTELKFPFPVGGRCYTIRIEEKPPAKEGEPHRIVWKPAVEHRRKPGKKLIEITVNEGYWELVPVDADHTEVTYYIYTDPAGSVPTFMANIAQRTAVPKVVEAVRKRAVKVAEEMARKKAQAARRRAKSQPADPPTDARKSPGSGDGGAATRPSFAPGTGPAPAARDEGP